MELELNEDFQKWKKILETYWNSGNVQGVFDTLPNLEAYARTDYEKFLYMEFERKAFKRWVNLES